jgi:hypothetical protein
VEHELLLLERFQYLVGRRISACNAELFNLKGSASKGSVSYDKEDRMVSQLQDASDRNDNAWRVSVAVRGGFKIKSELDALSVSISTNETEIVNDKLLAARGTSGRGASRPHSKTGFIRGLPKPPVVVSAPKQSKMGGLGMKRLIFAGMLALIATATQAQGTGSNPNSHPAQSPYTSIGPAGAGVYVEPRQQANPNGKRTDIYGKRGNINPYIGAVGTRNPRY